MKFFRTKGWGLRVFLLLEVAVFSATYLFGGRGLQSIRYMVQYNQDLQQENTQLRQVLCDLELQLQNWQSDDFYKEQFAREQLQLARAHEAVYYLV